jgi:signal transduction histidine kinase
LFGVIEMERFVNSWFEANSTLLIIVLAVLVVLLFIAAVVLLLLFLRARRTRTNESADQVDAELDRIELELSLAEQTGRLRIIRELHEVAVHSISVIIGQADGAQYAGIKYPRAAVRAASVIAESARDTLADLRRVMTVVREGEAQIVAHPELKSARDLFKVMNESGLEIEFLETGAPYALKPGAELAVYRILQTALANALKHGGHGTQVTVAFTWTDEGFQVTIDDDGVRAETRRAGLDPNEIAQQGGYDLTVDLNALTGVVAGPEITEMRERTELFGGVFTATAVPGVGFSVSASFPALRFHNGIHGVNLDA